LTTPALDQVADRAIDAAGAIPVIVGAQPDTPRHDAAFIRRTSVLSLALAG